MKKLNENKILSKITGVGLVAVVIIFSIQYFMISKYIKNEQSNQLKIYENIIGALKNSTNIDDNTLRDTILGEIDNENIQVGQAFLGRYGYSENMDIRDNKLFTSDKSKGYSLIIISIVISLLLIGGVIIYVVKKISLRLDNISEDILNITYGKKYIKRNESGTGVVAILNSRMNNLDNVIKKSLKDINGDRKILKELINDISHQVKTPIASLKLSNSFLNDEELTEDERLEFLKTSTEDIERLEWLSDGMIQIARLETGIVNLNIKENKLEDTLVDAINAVYAKAISKNIKLEVTQMQNVTIEHDYRWTKEAIINILDNAIKYTEIGGSVNISLEDRNEVTKINIQDTGCGIPKEEIYSVFKRFYRGRNIDIQRKEGSGLGLYLSRRIIEGQSGTIGLQSEFGVGSTFTINLYKKIL